MDDKTPVTVVDTPHESPHESTESKGGASELLTELPPEDSVRPASLQERFAAFLTDSLILLYLLGGWTLLLKYLAHGNPITPFSFRGPGWILFVSTSAALHFLYYLFFEAVLTATPGKMLGGLSIQKKNGGMPSLFAVLLRNFFRIIDYPLFFLTSVGLIESTHHHQRLGDVVAGTVVVREIPFVGRRIDPEEMVLGSVTRRALAFFLDGLAILPFFYGLLLFLPAHRTLIAMIGLNLAPALTLFYLTLSESLFQTTLGKAVFGLKVTQEDGRPASFATLLVRNIFRIFDTNPVGYLCAALSSRKQRPGDIAAGTVVARNREGWRGWFSIPYMIILAVLSVTLGLHNPNSFFKKGLRIQIASYHFYPIPMSLQRLTFKHLHLESLEFGFNEEELNRKAIYDPGDVIYLLMTISGYTVKNQRTWVQADIKVRDSNRNIVLDRMNIINASVTVKDHKQSRLATRFALHSEASPGVYEVTLTLRDLFGNSKLEERKSFSVRP